MTIEQLGSLGEIIAAIATLATLGYLALQIRLNAKSVRGSIAQGVIESEIAAAALITQHANVYRRGNANYSDLDDDERIVYEEIVFIEISQTWNGFARYQGGLMSETVFKPFCVGWTNYMERPGFRFVWGKFRGEFPEDFGSHVDRISSEKVVVAVS